MDGRSFARAVLPVVLAEAAFGLAYTFVVDEGDLTLMDWIFFAGTFTAFPIWAGARVARAGGLRRWSALGGVCVLLGTIISVAVSEAFWPTPSDAPWGLMFIALPLMVAPLLALLGLLGGALVKARINHVA